MGEPLPVKRALHPGGVDCWPHENELSHSVCLNNSHRRSPNRSQLMVQTKVNSDIHELMVYEVWNLSLGTGHKDKFTVICMKIDDESGTTLMKRHRASLRIEAQGHTSIPPPLNITNHCRPLPKIISRPWIVRKQRHVPTDLLSIILHMCYKCITYSIPWWTWSLVLQDSLDMAEVQTQHQPWIHQLSVRLVCLLALLALHLSPWYLFYSDEERVPAQN